VKEQKIIQTKYVLPDLFNQKAIELHVGVERAVKQADRK